MISSLFKNKRILGGLAAIVVVGLGYYLWSGSGSAPLLSTTAEISPGSEEVLVTLGKLHTIKLDPSLFTDPVFVSLSDFGVTIPPQNAGRRNPFAPLGTPAAH